MLILIKINNYFRFLSYINNKIKLDINLLYNFKKF